MRMDFIRAAFEICSKMRKRNKLSLDAAESHDSQVMMQSACLDSMPPEVILEIFESIPRRDLKSMRLASRKFQDYAKPLLFKTIYLSFNLKSFERLQEVAKNGTLRQLVQCVCYDGSDWIDFRASHMTPEKGMETWMSDNAGHGLYLSEEGRQKFLAQFSKEQLDGFYSAYCEHIRGQRTLWGSREERIRRHAIDKFPNLGGIYFSSPRYLPDKGLSNEPPRFESLSCVAQEILQQPDTLGHHKNMMVLFWSFVEGTCQSPFAPTLKEIRGADLHGGDWGPPPVSPLKGLSLVSSLQLSFCHTTQSFYKPSVKHIAEWLTQMPALETLHLYFGTNYKQLEEGRSISVFYKPLKLSDIFDENSHWDKLKNFSLRMIHADETELRHLLARHSKTLRSLELVNINLLNEGNAGRSGKVAASWLDFCYFLNKSMHLEKVTFGGRLSAHEGLPQKIQTQEPSVYKDFRPYPSSYTPFVYVRRQIEGFVMRKCPFPSVCPLEGQGEGKDEGLNEPLTHTIPWTWTPDSDGVWWLNKSY